MYKRQLPPKELRKLVDVGKKDIQSGIIIVFASFEDKVGLAVGVTEELIDKYDVLYLQNQALRSLVEKEEAEEKILHKLVVNLKIKLMKLLKRLSL